MHLTSSLSKLADYFSFLVVLVQDDSFFAFLKMSYADYEQLVDRQLKKLPLNITEKGELIYMRESENGITPAPNSVEFELVQKMLKFKYGV